MNVGQLRERIKDIPDHYAVFIEGSEEEAHQGERASNVTVNHMANLNPFITVYGDGINPHVIENRHPHEEIL